MTTHKLPSIKIRILFLLALFLMGCGLLPTQPDKPVTGRSLYVLNGLGQTVTRISLTDSSVNREFTTTGPVPAALNRYGDHLLILNSTPASVELLSPEDSTDRQVLTLPLGSNPFDLQVYGDRLYVSGLTSGKLYTIDAKTLTLLDSMGAGAAPEGIAVDEHSIYVASSNGWQSGYTGSSVHVISRTSLIPADTIPVGPNPQRLAWGNGTVLHVLCTGDYVESTGEVDVIDVGTGTVTTTLSLGGFPGYLLITPDAIGFAADFGTATAQDTAGFLYSYDAARNKVLHTSTDPIRVGYGAMGMAYDAQTDRLYVSNFKDNTVQALNPRTGEVLETYAVGDGPQSLVIL